MYKNAEYKKLFLKQKPCFYLTLYLCLIASSTFAKENASGDFDRPAQIIERIPPKYPTLALLKKIDGWVKVIFTISENGEILDPSILESKPPNVFEQTAVEAIKKFKINPAIKNGKPVAQRATQTLEFILPETLSNETQRQVKSAMEFEISSLMNDTSQGVNTGMPKDVVTIIKSVETKSKIKTHQRSLKELIINILPDVNGRPIKGEILKNTYRNTIDEIKIREVIDGAILRAQFTYDRFYGYYNPKFKMTSAKNQPARVIPTFAAKSKPLPSLSFEFKLTAKITINQDGKIIEVKDSSMAGNKIKPEITLKILSLIHFFEASKRYKSVSDEIDLKIIFSLIQHPEIN